MLKIERLTKYIDGKLIFKDISCAINDQHLLIRVAAVSLR